MKLSSVKPAENLYLEKNLLSSWELDRSVRMVYYHQSSVLIVRVWICSLWDNEGVPLIIYLWRFYFAIGVFRQQYDFFSHFCCLIYRRKVIVLCASTLFCSLWNISIFHCEPWLFIRMNWYSPWYLIVFVADGTIMYDAYSTLTIWSMVCEMPESVSVSVACSSMFTSELWKGWVVTEPVSLTIAVASFLVRLWVLVLLLTNPHCQLKCGWCMFRVKLLTGKVFQ